ncbi:MAG: tRNA lysidine(34) synthetase TilS, partial [Gammaproteobacteria bacterium]
MDFSPQLLAQRLRVWPVPARYVVLASGGCDSTVLLHAMAELAGELAVPIVVLHFDHGLAAESAEWARKVERMAADLGFACFVERLELAPGGAAETRAREARYARLAEWMQPGDCCLAAQHGDDQAETFLLQALRGAGPAGLAGMPAFARFGSGWLARPLLDFSRAELAGWAEVRGLDWIEDPANDDLTVPRNRLRHEVWPRIVAHWPAAVRTLARSAQLAAQSAALAEEIAAEDLARLNAEQADRLPIEALLALSLPRRRALLRHWLAGRGFALPAETQLAELERGFIAR